MSSAPLQNPLVLLFRGREIPIGAGCVIGRDASCSIRLDDPSVSRRHAEVTADGESLRIADLGSANGVFVNGRRIERPSPLGPGDKVVIGGEEFAVTRTGTPSPARSGAHPTMRETIRRVLTDPITDAPPAVPGSDATTRVDTFGLLSKVVDRVLMEGRSADAERMLAPQLDVLLGEATRRRQLPSDVAERAAGYALKLAEATKSERWANYAVKLYQTLALPMPVAVARSLASVARIGCDFDRRALRSYVSQMLTTAERLSASDRDALRALQDLAGGLSNPA